MVIGKYYIVEMSEFDDVYLGIEVDPFIDFKDSGAHFQFGLVAGAIEFERKENSTETQFTWRGSDEMDEVWGTGTFKEKSGTEIYGGFVFNNGDEYDFVATKAV